MAINQYSRSVRMKGLNGQNFVYKYIPLEYLLQLIRNRKLRIGKVSDWEDPYENFFLKSNFYTYVSFYERFVQVGTDEIRNHTYGQSWTLIEESDAMWRIYSQDKNAVRLKIKIDNLFNIVYTEDSCMATTSIGEVKYKTDEEITSWIGSIPKESLNIGKIAEEGLFIKRKPFEHEKEVRIIISKSTENAAEDFLEFRIPNLDVFEEFVLDPRLNNEEVMTIRQQLVTAGVNQDKIKESKLYTFTPVDLNI